MELDKETPPQTTNECTAHKQDISESLDEEKQTGTPTEQQTGTPTEKQTDTPTEQQTGTPTEKQTGTPTEKQTDTPTNTQVEATQSEAAPDDKMPEENQKPQLEEHSNSHFTTYSKEELDAFMVKLEDVVNPEMKDAAVTLLYGAKFPDMETHTVAVMENSLPKEATLVFDHQKEEVKIANRTIKSRQIRFACLNRIENTSFGYEVVLSFVTEDKKTRLLHIVNPDNAMNLVASLNSFRRLTYMLYKEILATVEEFGKALRDSSPIFTGSLKNLSVYNLETKAYEIQNDSMYLYLDTECLMILPSQFCEDSSYQMYFWKEAIPGSVDRVMVLHEKCSLYVETQKTRLEIPQYNEGPAKLFFECIRRLRPEPRGSFTDYAGRLQQIKNPGTFVPVSSPAEGGIGARVWAVNAPSKSELRRAEAESQQAYYYDNRMATDTTRLKSFREDLRSAVSRFENQDEISLPWVIAEDELRRMLDEGFVPETDIMSGGLDPNNLDHFMKCEEEIEHQLVQQQYDRALSRLQGTKQIFKECQLQEMRILLGIDDVTLLKQMYFHSFA